MARLPSPPPVEELVEEMEIEVADLQERRDEGRVQLAVGELLGEAGPHPRLADGRLVDAAVVWVVKLVLEHLAQLVDVHADVRDLLVLQPHRVRLPPQVNFFLS